MHVGLGVTNVVDCNVAMKHNQAENDKWSEWIAKAGTWRIRKGKLYIYIYIIMEWIKDII